MKVIEQKYRLPFILITTMFLLWGLANNMTDTLLAAFKRIMDMSDTQTSFIQMAYYGAYFFIALPAALYIRKHSYKSGIILGLLLYACGAILFLPAAKAASYAFYLIAIYIMAAGCSVLETTSNPYIMSMGSPETATRRLNIAQSFNPIGSITGILMSKYFILQDISLYSVSGTYMSLGLVLLAILIIMLFSHMPEGQDTDRHGQLSLTFRRLFRNKKYLYGIIAQFFYVGAQTCVWSFTIRIVMKELNWRESEAATIYLISIIAFCVSRFAFTALMKFFSPSSLLLAASIMSIVSSVAVVATTGTGWLLVIFLIAVSIFMSLMFPTIYGLALADIENPEKGGCAGDTKIGASGLIMAILGGAVLTPLQGIISDTWGINISYMVPAICFAVILSYSLYVIRTEKRI